ncbi:MAG: methyltransferase domain-containing protein [Pseudomonadota bacterium]
MPGEADLIDFYRNKHATEAYGDTSVKYLRFLRPEIALLHPRTVIDYGCGQSRLLDILADSIGFRGLRYDPAIPDHAARPEETADLLICIDVLEHVEEAELDHVIGDMRSLCREAIIVVDTKAAVQMLPDGRNAHVSLHPHAWWQARLERHFGPLTPIRCPRRSRAGFRSFPRASPVRFAGRRLGEDARHYLSKLTGRRAD